MSEEPGQIAYHDGPFLAAAFLCEKVLTEGDGVKSAIRIIDRTTRTVTLPNPPAEMEPFEHQLVLFLKFKSGRARGPYDLSVRLVKPSFESSEILLQTIQFEGEDHRGIDVAINMMMKLENSGHYWLDVSLNGIRMTRVPLQVVYQPIRQGPSQIAE